MELDDNDRSLPPQPPRKNPKQEHESDEKLAMLELADPMGWSNRSPSEAAAREKGRV